MLKLARVANRDAVKTEAGAVLRVCFSKAEALKVLRAYSAEYQMQTEER